MQRITKYTRKLVFTCILQTYIAYQITFYLELC